VALVVSLFLAQLTSLPFLFRRHEEHETRHGLW
jgi:hypothetical protein